MRNIKLKIGYDGSSFRGWAAQPGLRTVCGELVKALTALTGERIKLSAASRTDAGVHASGQVVNFKTASSIPVKRLVRALNRMLPKDVAVFGAREVPASFSARRARAKLYSYVLAAGGAVPAGLNRFLWHMDGELNVREMRRAARGLVGRHDFSSFAVADRKRRKVNPVRHISSIQVQVSGLKDLFGDLGGGARARAVRIRFLGDSFLYKMVRSIVGTLVDVGRGKMRAEDIRRILAARNRQRAGRTAPPQGLTLVKVMY